MRAHWISLTAFKVHNIVQKIGYPTKSPDVRDPKELQDYYETVNITNTEFFDNAISIARFEVNRGWSALGKPTDRDEWGMSVPTVNVSISHSLDLRLLMPIHQFAGILQSSWK